MTNVFKMASGFFSTTLESEPTKRASKNKKEIKVNQTNRSIGTTKPKRTGRDRWKKSSQRTRVERERKEQSGGSGFDATERKRKKWWRLSGGGPFPSVPISYLIIGMSLMDDWSRETRFPRASIQGKSTSWLAAFCFCYVDISCSCSLYKRRADRICYRVFFFYRRHLARLAWRRVVDVYQTKARSRHQTKQRRLVITI